MESARSWTLANPRGILPSRGAAVRNLPPVTWRSSRLPLWLCHPSDLHPRRRTTSRKEHLLVTCCTRSTGDKEGDRRPPENIVPGPIDDRHVKHVPDSNPWVVCRSVPLLGNAGVKKVNTSACMKKPGRLAINPSQVYVFLSAAATIASLLCSEGIPGGQGRVCDQTHNPRGHWRRY